MPIEHTREVMARYWNSDHRDVSMMAQDVVSNPHGDRTRASRT
jgi:hypothetical protein